MGNDQTAMDIETLFAKKPSLHRCDGTLAELAAYRLNRGELGWTVRGEKPKVGDLLVGVVGRSSRRRIVNVNRVEGIKRTQDSLAYLWEDKTDVRIAPTVSWGVVLDRMVAPAGRNWGILTDGRAGDFIAALCAEIRDRQDLGEIEGAAELSSCRGRSAVNRREALDLAKGICETCGIDLRSAFGVRGDRGLEAHHKTPLSHRPKGKIVTRLSDLVILCATCHRLLHADPSLDMAALKDEWALGRH